MKNKIISLLKKKDSKDYLFLLSMKPITVSIGFIITFLLTASFGAQGYGKYVIVLSFIAIVSSFFDLRSSEIIVRYFSKYKDEEKYDKAIGIFWYGIILSFIVGCLVVLVVYLLANLASQGLYNSTDLNSLFIVYAFSPLSAFLTPISFAFFQIYGVVKFIAVYELIYSLLKLFVVYFFGDSLASILIGFVLIGFVLSLGVFYFSLKYIKNDILNFSIKNIRLILNKDLFNFSFHSFFSLTIKGIGREIDKILIAKFLSIETVGIYRLAQQITGVLNILSSPVGTIIYPKLVNLWNSGNIDGYKSLLLKIVFIMFIVTLIPAIFVYILDDNLIMYFWGEEFKESIIMIDIMLVGIVIGNMFNPLVRPVFLSIGKPKLSVYGNLYQLFLTLVVFYISYLYFYSLAPAITLSVVTTLYIITFYIPQLFKLKKSYI